MPILPQPAPSVLSQNQSVYGSSVSKGEALVQPPPGLQSGRVNVNQTNLSAQTDVIHKSDQTQAMSENQQQQVPGNELEYFFFI